MASPLKTYFDRSFGLLRRNTSRVIRMDIMPDTAPLTIFNFNAAAGPIDAPKTLATGSDADIGGLSTCELTAVSEGGESSSFSSSSSSDAPGSSSSSSPSHLSFHGNLSLHVPSKYAGRIRTGYAAFRNKSRPTLFGEETWDLGLYSHLKVEVAYRGLDAWRSRWVVNMQTDGPVRSDLFQHRLDLPLSSTPTIDTHTPGLRFTTLLLPLNSFVLTNSGQTSSRHVDMMRHKVRTVGFALLGGGRDDPAAAQTAAALASQERGRRIAAGGVGMPGADEEPDAELEALLASDRPAGAPAPVFAAQRTPSAYHRVGAAAQAPVVPPSEVGPMEGYYELAVRSVQAVNYDSEEAD